MPLINGCHEGKETPKLVEVKCPGCGEYVEVFVKMGGAPGQTGTLIADETADTGDEHAHLGLRTSTETAVLSLLLLCHCYFLISTWSIMPYSLAS